MIKKITEPTRWSIATKDPDRHFSDCDYWEYYDSSKDYYEAPFKADYGDGFLTYVWEAYGGPGFGNDNLYIMVAQLYATEKELEELKEFCPCSVCDAKREAEKNWLVWMVFLIPYMSDCKGIGCIKHGYDFSFPPFWVIKKARALRESSENK